MADGLGWKDELHYRTYQLRQAVTVLQTLQDHLDAGKPISQHTAEATTLCYLASQMGAHVRDLENAVEEMQKELGEP